MYWMFVNNSSSEIDSLLAKEDVTLQEVLDAENVIADCKGNKALIDFLLRPDIMKELVCLTTREPPADIDECIRFKYPNIACEVLISNVPAINERLASEKELLEELYSFLENEPPLNPLLASYFSKIMGALIARKTEQALDFLKAKDNFISLLLKHLGTSAIMDLMLKLLTQVESWEMKKNILNWLDSQQIMQSLVSLFNPKIDKERHYNVAQLLCDFIRIDSADRIEPDPLLNTLESSETVALLLDNVFEEVKCESAIVGGIQVLLSLIEANLICIPKVNYDISYNSNINEEGIDVERRRRVIQSITDGILPRLKDFHDILLNPPPKPPVFTTVGKLDPPLGNTRLQVVRLFAAVISSNSAKCLNEIVALDTFPVMFELFFKYTWNNFLHTQVENCLVNALILHQHVAALSSSEEEEGGEEEEEQQQRQQQQQEESTMTTEEKHSDALTRHLLVDCNVIDRILTAWRDNDEQQKEAKGIRKGYMGHLITMVNKIVELCSDTSLGQYLNDNLPDVSKSLAEFKEGTLKETNALRDTLLGGAYPNASNDASEDYAEVSFPQDQIYTNYQQQQLASHNIDGYSGFNDDTFNDTDEALPTIDSRMDMNFGGDEDGDACPGSAEMFKTLCESNVNYLEDTEDQIFRGRDQHRQTDTEKSGDDDDDDRRSRRHDDTAYNNNSSSDDSDDEEGGDSPSSRGRTRSEVEPMDVDPWTPPTDTDGLAGVLSESVDPWGSSSPSPAKPFVEISVGDGGGGGGTSPDNNDLFTNGGPNAADWADFSSARFETNFDEPSPAAFGEGNTTRDPSAPDEPSSSVVVDGSTTDAREAAEGGDNNTTTQTCDSIKVTDEGRKDVINIENDLNLDNVRIVGPPSPKAVKVVDDLAESKTSTSDVSRNVESKENVKSENEDASAPSKLHTVTSEPTTKELCESAEKATEAPSSRVDVARDDTSSEKKNAHVSQVRGTDGASSIEDVKTSGGVVVAAQDTTTIDDDSIPPQKPVAPVLLKDIAAGDAVVVRVQKQDEDSKTTNDKKDDPLVADDTTNNMSVNEPSNTPNVSEGDACAATHQNVTPPLTPPTEKPNV